MTGADLYRRTIVAGEDPAHGRTRYFYGWARVTFHSDGAGRVGTTVVEWREPPRGSDHYPGAGDFEGPPALPAAPAQLDRAPPVIDQL